MQKNRGVIGNIAEKPFAFAAAFLVFFLIGYVFLFAVGATPDPLPQNDSSSTAPVATAPAEVSQPESPVRIVAKDISLDSTVVNPTSTDDTVLDDALTEGAVRYPTSSLLGVDGTMYIFGHSSYLPVVYHQYYKTFDGIQNLKPGEVVSVYSGTTEYRYSVTAVKVVDSSADQTNILDQGAGKHLVLSTCDSFATKSTRYVVMADFVGAYSLGN